MIIDKVQDIVHNNDFVNNSPHNAYFMHVMSGVVHGFPKDLDKGCAGKLSRFLFFFKG